MDINSIVFSVVPNCNQQCVYCQNWPYYQHLPKKELPLTTIFKTINSYYDVATKEGNHKLHFTYSGGEPLLAGIEYFKKIIEYQKDHCKDICITNVIQTNGTLINDEWIDFFKHNDIHISVTVDGPPFIHNYTRPLINNKESLHQTLSGLEKVRDNNLSYGVLTVITEKSAKYPQEIFNFLYELHPKMVGILPCVDYGPIISPGSFARFMIKFFDLWVDKDDPSFLIRDFRHIILSMMNIPHIIGCQYAGKCPSHINIAPNGEVSVCDQFIGKSEGFLGNVNQTDLEEIINSDSFIKVKKYSEHKHEKCNKCRFFPICNGGCVYRRLFNNNLDYFCSSRIKLFNHIENYLLEKFGPAI